MPLSGFVLYVTLTSSAACILRFVFVFVFRQKRGSSFVFLSVSRRVHLRRWFRFWLKTQKPVLVDCVRPLCCLCIFIPDKNFKISVSSQDSLCSWTSISSRDAQIVKGCNSEPVRTNGHETIRRRQRRNVHRHDCFVVKCGSHIVSLNTHLHCNQPITARHYHSHRDHSSKWCGYQDLLSLIIDATNLGTQDGWEQNIINNNIHISIIQ